MIVPNVPLKYNCICCNYNTSRQSQYDRHLLSIKHNKILNNEIFVPKEKKFICECGKMYKFDTGYYRHKKKCFKESISNINNESIIDLFKLQMQENKEMHKIIIEQNKQIIELSKEKSSHVHNNNNNNINNKFNLNFFLNEQCKDALNIKDFILSLQLQLSDLENVGQLGYVEGISQIIVKGLKELDIYKRPVHCSDIKRETLYVKDENQWIKEENDKKKMKNVIQQITHKNIKNISSWVDKNPSCKDSTSNKNDEYMKLVSNCMSGDCEEEQSTNVNKIITKVAKEIIIEK
jgi:hypothetical protein